MKSLFRIATRTLGMGLLVAVCLVVVVTAKGIDPEVLVAFRSLNDSALPSPGLDSPADPLQFAQVEPTSRLDAPAEVRSTPGKRFQRTVVPRERVLAPPSETDATRDSTKELPALPPLPRAAFEDGPETDAKVPDAELLESPPEEMATRNDFEVALKDPNPKATASANESIPVDAKAATDIPMPADAPVVKSGPPNTPKTRVEELPKPDASLLTSRLDLLQEQLQKLTAEQEKQRLSHQSWLESAQLLQQQKLQAKLDEIDASLRDLKAKPDRLGKTEPYIQRLIPKDRTPETGSSPIVREERPGTDGEKRFSIESQGGVRELLDLLTQKANLNLVLTINVEGDVEMSLQNATADEALKAIQSRTGYVVEKAGKKVYVRPGPPMGYQREVFLPPVVQEPASVPITP